MAEGSSASTFEQWQQAANYRLVCKSLRSSGYGSIVFGIIAVVMGVTGVAHSPLNAILALIGLFLLAEGIWLLADPTPQGIFVDGIAMLLVGVWNLLVTVLNGMASHGDSISGFALLGVFQIVWGFQRFGRYKRVAALRMPRPSTEAFRQMDQFAQSIKKAKVGEQPDLIEFRTKIPSGQVTWKGRLSANSAVFLLGNGHIVFAEKKDVALMKQGEATAGKPVPATFGIQGQSVAGTIAPESLARFDAWKALPPELPVVAEA